MDCGKSCGLSEKRGMVEIVVNTNYLPHTKSLARLCGGLFFFRRFSNRDQNHLKTFCAPLAPRFALTITIGILDLR